MCSLWPLNALEFFLKICLKLSLDLYPINCTNLQYVKFHHFIPTLNSRGIDTNHILLFLASFFLMNLTNLKSVIFIVWKLKIGNLEGVVGGTTFELLLSSEVIKLF